MIADRRNIYSILVQRIMAHHIKSDQISYSKEELISFLTDCSRYYAMIDYVGGQILKEFFKLNGWNLSEESEGTPTFLSNIIRVVALDPHSLFQERNNFSIIVSLCEESDFKKHISIVILACIDNSNPNSLQFQAYLGKQR